MVTRFQAQVFLIMALVSSMIFYGAITKALATHTYTGHKWTKPIYWCIDPKFSSTLNSAIQQAATDLNNQPSSFIIKFKAWGDPNNVCINHVHYCTLDPLYLGYYTIVYYSNGDIQHADICITTDPHNKLDNSACQDFPPGSTNLYWHYNLRYILHHEFTHTTEQRHAGTAEASMMNPTYKCAYWSVWSTHDKDTLKFIYPDTTTLRAQSLSENPPDLHCPCKTVHEDKTPQIPFHGKIKHSGALQSDNGKSDHFDSIQAAKEKMQRLRR